MPQPTSSDVHVDRPLTNISVAYIQDQNVFVSTKVFPILPVDKQSDLYFVYTKNDWFRDEAQRRAPSTESAGSGYTLSTDSYNCDVYAVHKDVDNRVIANADIPLNPIQDATRWVTQKMLIKQERIWVADYFTSGVWDTDVTPADLWSDYAASDPLNDLEAGKEAILGVTGFEPNTLVMGWQVMRQLKHHPDLVDRIKYTQVGLATEDLLATLLGVQRIMVVRSIYATNAEGEAEAYDFNVGKSALLMYVAPSPGLYTPSAGYTFAWRGVSQGIGAEIGISTLPMRQIKSQRIEAEKAWDNKLVATDMGYFLDGVVA